jgi:DNA-binding CsgD family transcriptional regulator
VSSNLRPIERVILRLHREDVPTAEIAQKMGKKPGTINRILGMIDLKEQAPESSTTRDTGLRPLEKVVLRLRSEGESYGVIGNRLGRSGAQIRRIEGYANFKS